MIVLDTHVLVWLREGSKKLGGKSRRLIDRALAADELAVSAISFWEIATLVEKRRLRVDGDVEAWRRDVVGDGVIEIPVDGGIGVAAARLALHGDPADRIIVATAQRAGARLVSADEALLDWSGVVRRLDARV